MKDIGKPKTTRLSRVDIRSTPLGEIDLPAFDDLTKMAQSDPKALESLRQRITQEVITGAPTHMRERLSGLQFQIDMVRQRNDHPIVTCAKISDMMNKQLGDLRMALTAPDAYLDARTSNKATVLPFERTPKT